MGPDAGVRRRFRAGRGAGGGRRPGGRRRRFHRVPGRGARLRGDHVPQRDGQPDRAQGRTGLLRDRADPVPGQRPVHDPVVGGRPSDRGAHPHPDLRHQHHGPVGRDRRAPAHLRARLPQRHPHPGQRHGTPHGGLGAHDPLLRGQPGGRAARDRPVAACGRVPGRPAGPLVPVADRRGPAGHQGRRHGRARALPTRGPGPSIQLPRPVRRRLAGGRPPGRAGRRVGPGRGRRGHRTVLPPPPRPSRRPCAAARTGGGSPRFSTAPTRSCPSGPGSPCRRRQRRAGCFSARFFPAVRRRPTWWVRWPTHGSPGCPG